MTVKWNKEEIKVEENKVDRRKAPIMLYVAPTLMEIEIEDKSFSVFFFFAMDPVIYTWPETMKHRERAESIIH
jgi:hypothetical protein